MSQQIVKFVRKANNLVEARYKFDIWEMRLFTKMLTLIRRDDEDFKDYKIYLRDIVLDFQLAKNKEAYHLLREGAKKLMTKTFYIPYELDGVKRQFETPVISGLDSAVTEGGISPGSDHLYLTISFHPKMKPFLLQLKSQFTMYDVRNILQLPSTYSIRIYELLKQYEKIGWRLFTILELKSILGIEDKYKLYGHFKNRVILKAQSDLAEFTDIQFTFEEIKKGRGVKSIKFYIRKNKDNPFTNNVEANVRQVEIIELPVIEQGEPVQTIVEELHLLVGKWLSKKALSNLLDQYPEVQVRNAIKYTLNRIKKGDRIQNVGGHIVNMAKHEEIIDPIKKEQKKRSAKKRVAEELQKEKQGLEKDLKAIYSKIHNEEMQLIEDLVLENPTAKTKAMDRVKLNRLASYSYDESLSDTDNLKKPTVQGAYINAFKKDYPKPFLQIDNKYEAEIKDLKRRISRL